MKTILVVDDDELMLNELLSVLELEGYKVIGAPNGYEGILLAQEHQPALVISDIAMPVLDGFGIIAGLRKDPQTAHIPVIFVSGQTEPSIVQHALHLGAAAILAKPYALKELLATIKTQID